MRKKSVLLSGFFLLGAPASFASTLSVVTALQFAQGSNPYQSVTIDAAGNIYLETYAGGTPHCPLSQSAGCGTVVRVDPTGQATPLVTFNGTNGDIGEGDLTLVGSTLYGSAEAGPGFAHTGVVFSVHTDGSAFHLLYSFSRHQGSAPAGPLVVGADGSVYGQANVGGPFTTPSNQGFGVLFRITPDGKFHALHNFTGGADGAYPDRIVRDKAGNLYGATQHGACAGGGHDCPTVFRYDPHGATFTILYRFAPGTVTPLIGGVAPDGSLYGSTFNGGTSNDGSLFALNPGPQGYTYQLVYSFTGGAMGQQPQNPPRMTRDGTLVGTAVGNFGQFPTFNTIVYSLSNGTFHVLYTFSSDNHITAPSYAAGVPAYDPTSNSLVLATTYGGIVNCGTTLLTTCGTVVRLSR